MNRCPRCASRLFEDTQDAFDYGQPPLFCLSCGYRRYTEPPAEWSRRRVKTPVRAAKAPAPRPHGRENRELLCKTIQQRRAAGETRRQIAEGLGVSLRTVDRHRPGSECACRERVAPT